MLYPAAFVAGLAVMAVEMSAVRLLAPWFGAGFEVWTLLLALVLGALALGYQVGGGLADRLPVARGVFGLLVAGGALVAALPSLAPPLLAWLAVDLRLAVLPGAALAVGALFVLPLTLLAMVSPYAVRVVSARPGDAGRAAGTLYALGTLGSILGTFLPGLVLLPALGTAQSFRLVGGVLAATGALGGLLSPGEVDS